MKKLPINEWAEEDRPREKMLIKGSSLLSDAELMAILIGSGNHTESAVQLSQRILKRYQNNLNELGRASVKELTLAFHGIGQAKALSILAALELGKRRNSSEVLKKSRVKSSRDAFYLFSPFICDLPYEELWIALVSRSGKVLVKQRISQGGVSGTAADIRLILKMAIEYLASGIFLCHNHPSGNIYPSDDDDKLTKRLNEACKYMDVSLLDHIIVSEKKYYSYADEGRIL